MSGKDATTKPPLGGSEHATAATAVRGSLEATFAELYETNRGRLGRLASAYAGGAEREDLLQEMLLQIWRGLPRFDGRAALDTWVYRVALNSALTWRRRDTVRKRHRADREDSGGAEVPLAPGSGDGAREIRLLHGFLRSLGKVERALLLLYLEGLSYREIADVLGIGTSNVGVKLHRIRKRLADHLEV